jgi:hypothetical protein
VCTTNNLTTFMCQLSFKSGSLSLLEPSESVKTCDGIALPLPWNYGLPVNHICDGHILFKSIMETVTIFFLIFLEFYIKYIANGQYNMPLNKGEFSKNRCSQSSILLNAPHVRIVASFFTHIHRIRINFNERDFHRN